MAVLAFQILLTTLPHTIPAEVVLVPPHQRERAEQAGAVLAVCLQRQQLVRQTQAVAVAVRTTLLQLAGLVARAL